MSFRDVEDLLAERGILVSYETVRRWVNHFGPMIAADLRRRRSKPHTIWHLDEVYLKIDGRLVYLWRAVDAEGEVLDVLVQTRLTSAFSFSLFSIPYAKVCLFKPGGLSLEGCYSVRRETFPVRRHGIALHFLQGDVTGDCLNFLGRAARLRQAAAHRFAQPMGRQT